MRGVVNQELRRLLGTIIDEELAARQNGDEPEPEPTPPPTRRCLTCHEHKPLEDFPRDEAG